MDATSGALLTRVRGEYLEMPGLSLTLTQAQRLWGLDRGTCAALLSSLVRAGFLLERRDGSYVRARTGHERSATTNRLGGRP